MKVLISGIGGKMGSALVEKIEDTNDCTVVAGVDPRLLQLTGIATFTTFDEVNCDADILIDFSTAAATPKVLAFCQRKNMPLVLCTTGLSEEILEQVNQLSKTIPVFRSFNMSLGINLLLAFAKKATETLGVDFDIEIIEKHHRKKIDAPSGTALMIADVINKAAGGDYEYNYGRHDRSEARPQKEIGISSVRGGTIVGDHDILFAGHNETFTISHSVQSREIFATGAVRAAFFLMNKPAGLYNMSDLIDL